jgi:hypothetical protein
MTEAARPLPVWRLVLYVLILLGCGAVAAYESYYWFAADQISATVVGVGKASNSQRHARYWATYEYTGPDGIQYTGRVDGVPPVTQPGQTLEIQCLRQDLATSRLAVSPAAGVCYGTVAAMAVIAFVGEIVIRRKAKRRTRKSSLLWKTN